VSDLIDAVFAILEKQVRPSLEREVKRQYAERSGGVEPTDLRLMEIMERCTKAMRVSIEESFDKKLDTVAGKKAAVDAMFATLRKELDSQFPELVIKTCHL
jgi:hypothetical protein